MKVTVTQRVEINGNVEEYSVSADFQPDDPTSHAAPGQLVPLLSVEQVATKAAKELFKALP
jgi:hypothetical protein